MITSVPLARGIHVSLLRPVQRETLDDALLLAIADAVLPTSLGADGTRRAAADFQNWVRGYVPNVERNHPYGSARITSTGADPAPRWAAQLRALESAARASANRGFAALGVAERQGMVREQLAQAGGAIPGEIAGAQHVALALLASFYSSPEATDMCYDARIQKNACRPLSSSAQRPLPLAPSRGARP
jgi:hypothetical protein